MTHLAKAHVGYSHIWYTPPEWLSWARETFGGQYFDPCPQDWDGEISGLEIAWPAVVYCNHPGGRGQAAKWWAKFLDCHPAAPRIWCGFSIEQLRTLSPSPLALDGWLTVPHKRIGYVNGRTGERSKSPAQASFFWSTCTAKPAPTPSPALVVRTGVR